MLRVGDLSKKIKELNRGSGGFCSPQTPMSFSGSDVNSFDATVDGNELRIFLSKHDDVTYVRLNEYADDAKDNIHLHILDATSWEFIIPSPFGASPEYRSLMREISKELQDRASLGPDTRVVHIGRIDTAPFDRGTRFVHAAVAFLVSKGLISCDSLVATRADNIPEDCSFRRSFVQLGDSMLVSRARDLFPGYASP